MATGEASDAGERISTNSRLRCPTTRRVACRASQTERIEAEQRWLANRSRPAPLPRRLVAGEPGRPLWPAAAGVWFGVVRKTNLNLLWLLGRAWPESRAFPANCFMLDVGGGLWM